MLRKKISDLRVIPTECPDLLDLQFRSFNNFFSEESKEVDADTLDGIFRENFPISDSKKYFTLEYLGYTIEKPIYTPEECIENGMDYEASIKVRLRITTHETDGDRVQEKELFFGNIPYMAPQASFIVNGIERVIVPQLHRSYGVFFSESIHISGEKLFSAKIIPQKGTWLEFATDLNKCIYAYVNYRKKILITVLLRVLGYSTDRDILGLFGLVEEVKVTPKLLEKYKGWKLAAHVLKIWTEELVDEETGEILSLDRSEVLLERDTELNQKELENLLAEKVKTITLYKENKKDPRYIFLYNSLEKDDTITQKEAIEQVYQQLRGVEAPDEETAKEFVQEMLFSPQRSYLGKVGRYCINKKLGLNIPPQTYVITKEDLLKTIDRLFSFINGEIAANDIDHLSNRRVKVVGEQLHEIFSLAITRMSKTIQDRMNVRSADEIDLRELISIKTFSTIKSSFFQTSPLSQFMDQTNPLSEIEHKRRVTAIGGGLSKDRAGFEVRDVHHTHYGRICPIKTPEGLGIGLISSLALYAYVNQMGFIETPYRLVKNGRVDLLSKPKYYGADEESDYYIAHATTPLDDKGQILSSKVQVRKGEESLTIEREKVDLIDVSRDQIVSASASLAVFISNNESSRGLMASNMQLQAVPLLEPASPIVGTGVEKRLVKDSRTLVKAKYDGKVVYVDSEKIVIENNLTEEQTLKLVPKEITYKLRKMVRTNQNTCMNQYPVVKKGQLVKAGDSLCEGFSTQGNELALGKDLKVAFMPFKGSNFEDAIVISERVVKEDIFSSIHLSEYELDLCDTKFGPEEFTAEIPNVSEKGTAHLDENGLALVGTHVREGDILIGRVTPKGRVEQTPEGRILESIFGANIYNKKDTSLRVPPSVEGVVVEAKIKERVKKDKITKEMTKRAVEKERSRIESKLLMLRMEVLAKLEKLLSGLETVALEVADHKISIPAQKKLDKKKLESLLFVFPSLRTELKEAYTLKPFDLSNWTEKKEVNTKLLWLVNGYEKKLQQLENEYKKRKLTIEVGDFLPLGIFRKAKVVIAKLRKLKVGDKMAGRHGNKGVVAKIAPEHDLPYFEDGTPVDIVLNPLGIPSRMNIGQLYEALLGWAGSQLGQKYAIPIFESPNLDQIHAETDKAGIPRFGLAQLYDGETGEPFASKTTCGVIYMLKLGHLVDDKMHARSTGPYALITQQPLGGKSQFGGQRLGEMEVWALEAYGAANLLQECLTYKSDDILGRRKAVEAMVKGERLPKPGLPEAFLVLVRKLRGLCIEITPLK